MPTRKDSRPKPKADSAPPEKKAPREWEGSVKFRKRLATLIAVKAGKSRTAFADLLGVSTSHVSKWCDHGVAPGAEMLLTIARETKVSIDWLLGCSGGESPMLLNQYRTTKGLEDDVSTHLEREITTLYPAPKIIDEGQEWWVDGKRVLEQAVALLRQDAESEIAESRELKQQQRRKDDLSVLFARLHKRFPPSGTRISAALRREKAALDDLEREYHDVTELAMRQRRSAERTARNITLAAAPPPKDIS